MAKSFGTFWRSSVGNDYSRNARNTGIDSRSLASYVRPYEDGHRAARGLDRADRISVFVVQAGGFDLIELAASPR